MRNLVLVTEPQDLHISTAKIGQPKSESAEFEFWLPDAIRFLERADQTNSARVVQMALHALRRNEGEIERLKTEVERLRNA